MTGGRDDFFNSLFDDSGDHVEALRAQRQLTFEESVIKRIFNESGIAVAGWGRLVNECRTESGLPKLNFGWFNRRFNFPAKIYGRRVKKIHELVIADLFRAGGKNNKLVRFIARQLNWAEVDTSKPFVFFFRIINTLVCAHNLDASGHTGPSWTIRIEDAILTLETSKSYLAATDGDWFTE